MDLDCVILKRGPAVSYGSASLKSLQNENVPELDLLVREAIQNSSDAALNVNDDMYSVNFKTDGGFNPVRFNSFLTGEEKMMSVGDVLNERYPGESEKYLEIRDTGTDGLTGPTKFSDLIDDDHGNFLKLIFDSGIKQANKMAGGNWGFGKSVYYRVGVGIVIYYSRINLGDSFEDRLIITLIEDESKPYADKSDTRILNIVDKESAGKAWWGIKNGDDVLPLTDTESIQEILDVFGLKLFDEGETGTSIIIPYIDEKKLLSEILPVDLQDDDDADGGEGDRKNFEGLYASDLERYLILSVQKWYAPIIHNREFEKYDEGKKWLSVLVNDTYINKNEMNRFFLLVQELYTTALSRICDLEHPYISEYFSNIETDEIRINGYFEEKKSVAGYISSIKISSLELMGNILHMMSPYYLVGKFDINRGEESPNEPIIMFARDLGMVINYETSGDWVKGLKPPENKNEYLFGFFVPNTKNEIKKDFEISEYRGMCFGEYLRECEASDHMGWKDPVKMKIVQRIQRHVISKINNHFESLPVATEEAVPSKLAKRLGKYLMPRNGFNNVPVPGPRPVPGPIPAGKSADFRITSFVIEENIVKLKFSLSMKSGINNSTVSLKIATEKNGIDAKTWEKDIHTNFPVQISECCIEKIKTSIQAEPYVINAVCNDDNSKLVTDELQVELLAEAEQTIYTKIKFSSSGDELEILGMIILNSRDKKYQFTLSLES